MKWDPQQRTRVTNEAGALLEASNGSVYLSARAASDVAASVVNEGTVRADAVNVESFGGSVFLDAGSLIEGRQVDVITSWLTGSGSVKPSGVEARVRLSSEYISLSGRISADTDRRGGLVQINGTTSVDVVCSFEDKCEWDDGGRVQAFFRQQATFWPRGVCKRTARQAQAVRSKFQARCLPRCSAQQLPQQAHRAAARSMLAEAGKAQRI